VGANIDTTEAEVVVAEVAVVEDLAPAVDDLVVITDFASRVATEVAAEATETAVELLESNDLGLDFTDGLSDDFLGHLADDDETLLDNVDGNVAADKLVPLHDDLLNMAAREIVPSVKVIEAVEGSVTTPVVEGGPLSEANIDGITTASGSCANSGSESKESDSEFSEHDERLTR